MRKLIVLAIVAAAAWYGWTRFGPRPGPIAHAPDATPAADMKSRIDSRTGVAPE